MTLLAEPQRPDAALPVYLNTVLGKVSGFSSVADVLASSGLPHSPVGS